MAYLHKETRNTSFIHFENRVIELTQEQIEQESGRGGRGLTNEK